jgi:hypothetical protein
MLLPAGVEVYRPETDDQAFVPVGARLLDVRRVPGGQTISSQRTGPRLHPTIPFVFGRIPTARIT